MPKHLLPALILRPSGTKQRRQGPRISKFGPSQSMSRRLDASSLYLTGVVLKRSLLRSLPFRLIKKKASGTRTPTMLSLSKKSLSLILSHSLSLSPNRFSTNLSISHSTSQSISLRNGLSVRRTKMKIRCRNRNLSILRCHLGVTKEIGNNDLSVTEESSGATAFLTMITQKMRIRSKTLKRRRILKRRSKKNLNLLLSANAKKRKRKGASRRKDASRSRTRNCLNRKDPRRTRRRVRKIKRTNLSTKNLSAISRIMLISI